MTLPRLFSILRQDKPIWALVAIQILCGGYFLWDILASVLGLPSLPLRWQTREFVELGASLGLVVGGIFGLRITHKARHEIARADNARRLTSGEFVASVDTYFEKLNLSQAETEVAWFLLKGQSIADIAALRDTREGTVKAQCTAIYRKAGVSGKSQLFSLIVEDVLL